MCGTPECDSAMLALRPTRTPPHPSPLPVLLLSIIYQMHQEKGIPFRIWDFKGVSFGFKEDVGHGHPPNKSQGGDFSKHRKSVGTESPTLSTVSSKARSFTTSYTSASMTETTTGFNFEKPSLPLLIFYLRANEVDKVEMSFLSIERKFCSLEAPKSPGLWSLVDKKTVLKDHSCSCGRNRTNCIHSTLERSGDMAARRVEAEKADEELNLANLGIYQRPKTHISVKKMKYIHIEFKTREERVNFESRINETKQIYNEKLHWYWEDMRIQQQDQNVSLFQTMLMNKSNLGVRFRDSQDIPIGITSFLPFLLRPKSYAN